MTAVPDYLRLTLGKGLDRSWPAVLHGISHLSDICGRTLPPHSPVAATFTARSWFSA